MRTTTRSRPSGPPPSAVRREPGESARTPAYFAFSRRARPAELSPVPRLAGARHAAGRSGLSSRGRFPGLALRRLVTVGAGLAAGGAALTVWNRVTVPRLSRATGPITETVTVCVPARDEAERVPALISDLRAQTGIPRLRILVLDDASGDHTAARAREAMDADPRCTLLRGTTGPPPGWTGKAAACHALADTAEQFAGTTVTAAGVLVFLDADIRLAPGALSAAVTELLRRDIALLSPWPRQQARSFAERLVQPLLCWSWASTLPVVCTDRGIRTSTVVACGQFLVFDAAAYRAIGGHAAVADSATEDLDIARALRRAGFRTGLATAGDLARTRMYRDARELAAGYRRWLWSAYGGSVAGGLAVAVVAAWAYLLPPLAAVFGRGPARWWGLSGYAAAGAGRVLARSLETGRPPKFRDIAAAAAHPLGVTVYFTLWARSQSDRRRNALTWKGRALYPGKELDSR
ncbi:glycosyltransferase [Nocardia speluncae]|uniref:Glycosyltransferase n=1 Tax=Nocardia speluncae TaxID=419477 RepID=A0A846XMV9_9NOCA|nr:glycosyltransferase [Nocardia speluncae]